MDAPTLLTHRLGWGRAISYAVLVLAALGAIDGLRRGLGDRIDIATVLVAAAVGCLAYVLGVRPAVVETTAALEVRNPLRTTIVPWAEITGLRSDDVLVVETGERDIRCFALPRRHRHPITSNRRTTQDDAGTSAAVMARLEQQARILAQGRSAPVTTTYAASALATLAVAAAAVVLAVVAARGA